METGLDYTDQRVIKLHVFTMTSSTVNSLKLHKAVVSKVGGGVPLRGTGGQTVFFLYL